MKDAPVILSDIIDLDRYPMDAAFGALSAATLDRDGVLVLPDFIRAAALSAMQTESAAGLSNAYFCAQNHSVYLSPPNDDYPADHPENRQVVSSKGCICDDEIAPTSPLRTLYDDAKFRDFVKCTTGQTQVHAYADPLSSINIHYANRGQELGWHFDNSSFAITLLIQKPDGGARFEYSA